MSAFNKEQLRLTKNNIEQIYEEQAIELVKGLCKSVLYLFMTILLYAMISSYRQYDLPLILYGVAIVFVFLFEVFPLNEYFKHPTKSDYGYQWKMERIGWKPIYRMKNGVETCVGFERENTVKEWDKEEFIQVNKILDENKEEQKE